MIAVILAAGLGTRFLPVTKAIPKEMLPIVDKPAIQYIVEEADAADADPIVIVTSKSKPAIEAHFEREADYETYLEEHDKADYAEKIRTLSKYPVAFVYQEEQLGSGHAVNCARDMILASGTAFSSENLQTDKATEPFFVLLGDVIVPNNDMLQKMMEVSKAHDMASVIAVNRVSIEETKRYGVIDGIDLSDQGEQGVWQVRGLVEKPQSDPPSNLAIFGRYLLSPKVLQILPLIEADANGEYQLTDALVELIKTDEMYALEIKEDDGYDVGTIKNWLIANHMLSQENPEYTNL
ncbi:MAG: sugar phosphate nucleotidyltransferase [Coriobacteriia bacterium]|nr:sugar phosphate nucleotidyltransferase [Coriobacteriia bacterium]MCL2136671.1 sugar phosphate nucleotidyltransferase [Coriobacteriia bacterium]